MQQLQPASDPAKCARSVLETVLAVMVSIRESAAGRQDKKSADAHGPASLIHIRTMGVLRKRPGATLSAVADQLALTLSATSRLVDGLVDQGLVQRVIPPGNRRTVSLMLTPAGTLRLETAIRQSQQDLVPLLKTLTPRQRQQLCTALDTLRTLFDHPTP